jgi:hypothetical protein
LASPSIEFDKIGKGTASQVAEKLASTHYNGAEFPVVQDREGHGFSRAEKTATQTGL